MSLSLKNLVTSDTGLYRCVVSNHFGEINRTFDLTVLEKDTLNQTIAENELVILECPLFKDLYQSAQSVKWYKRVENESLSSPSRVQLDTETSYIELTLHPVTYPPHNLFQTVALTQLVAKINPKVTHMQLADGSLLFRNVRIDDRGSYLCSRTSLRQWSRRIELNVVSGSSSAGHGGGSSSFSQLVRPLLLLFVIVIVSFVLVGVFIKFMCERPCTQMSKSRPKQVKQQPQSTSTMIR